MMVKSLNDVNELRAIIIVGKRTRGSRSVMVTMYETWIDPEEISLRKSKFGWVE
jgi:hypothetical protein